MPLSFDTAKKINQIPDTITAANTDPLLFEVDREVTPGNYQSAKISDAVLRQLLINAGAPIEVVLAQRYNDRGTYVSGTTYSQLDAVKVGLNHYLYVNITPSNNVAPPATTHWLLFATDGAPGTNGTNGTNAPQWLSGTSDPLGADGAVGDFHVRTDLFQIRKKTGATTWTLLVDGLTAAEANALYKPITEVGGTGLRYTFSTTTTSGPPTGIIRLNNTTLASVTSLFMHETDRNGDSAANVMDLLANTIRIQLFQSPTAYAWFRVTGAVTDNGSDRTIPVAYVSNEGTLANNVETLIGLYGGATASTALTIREVDGTPSLQPTVLEFPNTSLTDQGGGVLRVAFPASSSGGHVIEVNGTAQTQRANLNIVATGATATDDAPGDRTVVTIPVGSGGGGGITWSEVTAANATLAANTGVIANSSTAQNLTIAASPTLGQVNAVSGKGSGQWSLNVPSGGSLYDPQGNVGTGLQRKTTHRYATCELICNDATLNQWAIRNWTGADNFNLLGAVADTRATDYFAAVTAAGGSLTTGQQTAFQNYLTAIDAISATFWANYIFAFYPFLGGTAATHAVNAKVPTATYATGLLDYDGTVTHGASGAAFAGTGNGKISNAFVAPFWSSNKYMAVALYVSNHNSNGDKALFGDNGRNTLRTYAVTGDAFMVANGEGNSYRPVTGGLANPLNGHVLMRTVAGVQAFLHLDGVQKASTNGSGTYSDFNSTGPLHIMATGVTPSTFATGTLKSLMLLSNTTGLTQAQVTALRNADVAFQTALGRN